MATRKVKDDKGREYEIDVDDDDDDDDDGDGPFIDEADLKGLFEKWLGERESSQNPPKKKGAVRIKASQPTPPKKQSRTRHLRIA
jgi:hypothetical protein